MTIAETIGEFVIVGFFASTVILPLIAGVFVLVNSIKDCDIERRRKEGKCGDNSKSEVESINLFKETRVIYPAQLKIKIPGSAPKTVTDYPGPRYMEHGAYRSLEMTLESVLEGYSPFLTSNDGTVIKKSDLEKASYIRIDELTDSPLETVRIMARVQDDKGLLLGVRDVNLDEIPEKVKT